MPQVAAIVPTRDRLGDLQAAIAALRAQSRKPDRILVVDGSVRPETPAWLADEAGLEVLPPPPEGGAPGGFQAGIDGAPEADYLWLVDDDCVPAPDALAELLAVATGAGAVPAVRFGDGRQETGWRIVPRRGQEAVTDARPGDPVDAAPFAGLLLTADACRAAGPLRTDFFLWHADVEYCLRLRLAGLRLPAAPGALVTHPSPREHVRRILAKEVRVADFAPWREYYDTRNLVPLHRLTAGTPFDARRPLPARLAGELARAAAVLIADPHGARRLWMRALGALDGRRGRFDRHPERDPRWA